MNDDTTQPDDETPAPVSPVAPRRLGYSSRGNASPVGETTAEPSLTLPNPRATDDRLAVARKSFADDERLGAAQAKADATLAKKSANAALEADFRSTGRKFYTDSFGDLKPEVDEAGKPRYSESNWKKAQVDTTDGGKMWALSRRNEAGQTETRAPKLTTSGDLKDPNLYHDFGGLRGEREIAGHVDDLAQSADPETARAATAYRTKRNATLRTESLKPLRDAYGSAAAEVDGAKLKKGDLDTQAAKLNAQISALDSNPALKQTAGGFLGVGAEPTSEATRLQGQRAALQSQVDELAKQSGALDASVQKGGTLYQKHEQTKTEMDLWSHQSKIGELTDLAEQRRTFLKSQKRPEADDPVLTQILAKQQEFGVKASATQQRATELQNDFETERTKAAAAKTAVDQATFAKQAEQLTTGRTLLAQSFTKLNDDVKAGRIDPNLAAATRKSLLDAERDHARSLGQLAGMAETADAPRKQAALENSRARLVQTQGEQLYNLEKNANETPKPSDGILDSVSRTVGSAIRRTVEGTRDKDGTTRALLAKNPAVVESAKAAAFAAGDTGYSNDAYAKLPGKRIAIHPSAFTLQGLTPPGAVKPITWQDALTDATTKGDVDPKTAETMRRELTIKEKFANEAAIDATLDNDVFRRWLASERPDLTESRLLSVHSYDLNVPANNAELRTEAMRYLKAEPSVSQKTWNALKTVGMGALDTGLSGVRAIMPDGSAADTGIKEFSEGLKAIAMDPRLDHHWATLIGQGLGSSLAFATPAGAAGGLVQGLGVSAKAAKWTVSGMIAATGGASQAQSAYDEARAAGADKDVAKGAYWIGSILGATEVIPLERIVQRFGSAKAFTWASGIRNAAGEILGETAQEIGQNIGSAAVAQALYDRNKSLFDGLGESAIAAGGSAALMSAAASIVAGVRYHRTVGLLSTARQSREQAEQVLATVFERPDVAGVRSLLPTTAALAPIDARRTELETAIAAEAAKKNPNDDVMLSLHENLAQLELLRGSATRQLAIHAMEVAQATAQASTLPDFQAVDPETGEPIIAPATIGANRDAGNALVKIGLGVQPGDLTEAETQGLAIIGEQLGTEMVRDVNGQQVVTDKAREWLVDQAPGASRILRDTETERLASITAAAAQAAATPSKGAKKSNEKDQIQKEKGLLNPDPSAAPAADSSSATPAAGASVSFTDSAGKTQRQEIPADATIPSSGAPVRDQATAEQYLAETSQTPVRDVEYTAPAPAPTLAPAKPKAGQAVAPTAGANGQAQPTAPTVKDSLTVAPGAVAPGALLPHLVKRMRAAGADNKAITTAATTLAKNVNDTVARFGGLFGGRVTITDKSSNSGGVAYDSDSDSLIVSTTDLGRDAEALSANPERLEKIVREEAIHRAAVRLEKTGAWKADGLWQTLTPPTRDAFIRAYNRGGDFADFADRIRKSNPKLSENEVQQRAEWAAGHEMVRMLVQGRMSVENGKLTLDGAAISEETASPSLLAKLADILTKIRDYFTDLAGQLEKDGNDPAAVAEVNRVVELVTSKLQALERLAAEPSPATVATNTAETIEGEKIKGEWVKFAPESGTLDVARGEMPQFQNEHLGALTQFLAARGITHTMENVIPGTLKPTQGEYSNKKVQNLIDGAASGRFTPRSILVSSDGYILDRHHQFVAALNTAPETAIPIIRFGATIQELFDAAHDFPSVEYSNSSKGPATGKSETTPAKAPAKTAQSDRAALAQKLGLSEAQIGSTETVTHKGKTVRVVNLVVDASQVPTSHEPDGTVNPAYPQALQPRDRSTALYRDQQRRIAANPNLAEEFLSGTPDHGTPIMATVDGQSIVLIGNGRANAKALMYAAPDLAATAAQFKTDIAARAAEKGLTPEAVNAIAHPVLVRQILDDLSPAELRAFSQASNEFSGAATNAVEQAKVDASRLTPAALAAFNPEFDLDSAKNDDFRREFVRTVIGRAENITGPDLRRRVQAALFAKAFGDTDAGMAAFSRLAGEDDEGTRNLVRSMLDVAPAFAAMRAQIAAGNLHDLDLAPALTRAVQEIAVALREKPAAQSADVALDGLVNQTDLALDGARDPLDDTLLRFLVANRRNRSDLIAGLNAYTAGVYAAGDPKQADMFGAEPPSAAAILRTAVEDPRAAERQIAAAGIGRMLSSAPAAPSPKVQALIDRLQTITADQYIAETLSAEDKAALAEDKARNDAVVISEEPTWAPWYQGYKDALGYFSNGMTAAAADVGAQVGPNFYFRKKLKDIGRIVQKALAEGKGRSLSAELNDIKDTLGATFVVTTRAELDAAKAAFAKVFKIAPSALDEKDSIKKPLPGGYRDVKIRPEIRPGIRAEVIFITPAMHEEKNVGAGHKIYELIRTLGALKSAYNAKGEELPDSLTDLLKNVLHPASQHLYETAWAKDSTLFSQSARDISGDQSQFIGGAPTSLLPSESKNDVRPSFDTEKNGISVSSSRSTPTKNLAPAGGSNLAFITPTTTEQGAKRQPTNITTANISDYAGTVDVSAIAGKNGEIWKAFDRAQMDSTGRLVDIRKLISNKNELADPKFVAGLKADPRQTAANAMGWTITGDPRNTKGPRAPLDVFANADGTFTIIDGNATAQAAMLAGWNTLPVNVRPAPVLSSAPAELDEGKVTKNNPFGFKLVELYDVKDSEGELGYILNAPGFSVAGRFNARTGEFTKPGITYPRQSKSGQPTRERAIKAFIQKIVDNADRGFSLASAPAGDDLFGGMLETYAQALPTKAKRNKAEAKKLVAKELPALAPAAFDDLFSLAQREPGLTNSTSDRSGESTLNPDENQNRQPDTATAPANGGRAFGSEESNDLGPLFGNPGPATTGSDAGGPSADGNGNVADDPATRRDGVDLRGETAPLGETGERPAGATGSRPLGDAVGSLSGDVPGSGDAGGRRVDARASAESKRLARIARSESLAPDAQNHRIQPGDTIVPRGTKTRLTANVAAIKLLKRLETEQRKATPEEKRTLAKYVGWGALSQVFDNVKGQSIADGKLDAMQEEIDAAEKRGRYGDYYAKRNAENLKTERQALENWDNAWGEGYRALKDLLTAEEWEAARKSTLNAHYTDREIIGAMWRGLAQMGFKGGRVLEPAGGIGHFYGLMPEGMMRASELHGVELDSLSGRIFQALYPDAKIQVDGFQTARLPDNAFDLAVSNVPFAQTGPHDPIHANPKLNLHNYFFAKALDKVRPNGLIAFITTSNTMEAQTEQRAYLAERADFVGAVRLPNNAFSENAGTDVTTDIIFMRKRDGLTVPDWAETWKSKAKVGEDQIPSPRGGEDITVPITINEYFVRHPPGRSC